MARRLDGELIVSAAPEKRHQIIAKRLMWLLSDAEHRGLGEVFFAPVDVKLEPHNIPEPDLIFITTGRRHIFGPQAVDGPPDSVVEIVSPSSRTMDRRRKFALYERAGVPEYWLADPDARTIAIFVPGPDGRYQTVPLIDGLLRSTVLPDLVIDPAALFADLS